MKAILDTGPWVALIDRSESNHHKCVQWFKGFSGRLYSTEAVLTEVLYLLNFSITAQKAAFDFVLELIVEIIPTDIDSTRQARALMAKYADLPMDYADATLVTLAENAAVSRIVTLDKKDFSIYRLPGGKSFKILS
jgi:hypothetical protein